MPVKMLVAAPLIEPTIPFSPFRIPVPPFFPIDSNVCGRFWIAPLTALNIPVPADCTAPTIDVMPFFNSVMMLLPSASQLNAWIVAAIAWIICGSAAIKSGIA